MDKLYAEPNCSLTYLAETGARMAKRATTKTRFEVQLTGTIVPRFIREAKIGGLSNTRLAEILIDNAIAVDSEWNHQRRQAGVNKLAALIASLPGVENPVAKSGPNQFCWWLKFSINKEHPLVWHVIQRLGHVLNYISLDERFDVVFAPVSPPPDMNGGPEFLSWVIEARKRFVNPATIHKALRLHLPKNVRSTREWKIYDTD